MRERGEREKKNESLVQYYEVFVKCRRRTMATETEKGQRERERKGKKEKRKARKTALYAKS